MEVQNSPRVREKGLTLIELLVAIVILTFGAVAIISVLIEAQKSNNFARAKTMAVNAAEQEMEAIFKAYPADVGWFNGQHFPVQGLTGPPGNDPSGGNDPMVVTVDENEPYRVTVTVTWMGRGTQRGGRIALTARRSTAER